MANKGDIRKSEIQPVFPKNWKAIPFKEGLDKGGKYPKLNSSAYLEIGAYPIIDQGEKFIAGFTNEEGHLYDGELPVVIFGDHTRNIKFIDFEFAVGADGTKILKPKEENDPRFFFFYLKALRIPSFGYSRHFKVFEYLDLPIPPLPEQQRIVAKLDAIFGYLDVLNEKLERIPELLKNFRQQVLTQAVTGELTKEWREGNNIDFAFYKQIENYNLKKKKPVKARGQKGLDEKLSLFKLPKEWKWIPQLKIVKDGANSISAGPFGTIFKAKDFRDKGVPIIFLRHVKKEGFNQNKPKLMDEVVWEKFHKEYSVSGGELLVTKLGDPPGEATVYPKDIGIAMITPDVMKSDLNENFALPAYVSYFFNSSICKEFIANISFGMTRLRIDLTMFKSFPIPLPTIEEQTEIVKCVEVLFNLVDRIEDQFESLKSKIDQLPQAVLAKAFRGELVDQEVKEYVREVGELGMVAEGNFNK